MVSRVPQGSVLGLNLFINDIKDGINGSISVFANDTNKQGNNFSSGYRNFTERPEQNNGGQIHGK